MPILGAWIASLFGSLVAYLTQYLSKRIALMVAVVAAIVSFTAIFYAAISAATAAIAPTIPTQLAIAVSWFVPTNALECVSAVLAANIARWLYDYHKAGVQMQLF